ncbi:SpoIID/LytB domain-containing protein [Patescibacteria group bacterium]
MRSCPVKRTLVLFATLIYISSFLITAVGPIVSYAKDECKDIEDTSKRTECYEEKEEEVRDKLNETRNKLSGVQNTIGNLSSDLDVATQQIIQTQASINEVRAELEIINETLDDLRNKLEDKINFRNKLVRNYSKKSTLSDFELFLTSPDTQIDIDGKLANLTGFQYSIFVYAFNKATNEETIKIITSLNAEIRSYEEDKKQAEDIKQELEAAERSLVALKADLDIKKAEAEKEAAELAAKEEEYKEELSELQDKILTLKYGDTTGTVGDYEAPGAKTPDPPFKPAFAAFSYGAYTHYKGMSQYGAKGRAKDGDSYKDIIEFYYKEDVKEKDDFPDEICVQGYGDMDFQDYLYGLAEMPSSWDSDALKAQAIAARSYAYRYEKADKCICTTQSCQVFSESKSNNPPSEWRNAVDDTKDKIIDGSTDASGYGWYSSTTGGFIENVGWDVDGNWPGDAYEKKADSPWFRKAWYTKSYNDGSTCGHPHPWLDEEEMADIVNAYMVYTKGSDGEKGHISPLTTDCWGGEPYSKSEMRAKADKYGDAYGEVYSIDVDVSNGGYTSRVSVSTNNGSVSMDGQTFKTVFNLRAPSYVAIRSRLFDFEKED